MQTGVFTLITSLSLLHFSGFQGLPGFHFSRYMVSQAAPIFMKSLNCLSYEYLTHVYMIGIGWSPLQEIIGIENMLACLESFLHISK